MRRLVPAVVVAAAALMVMGASDDPSEHLKNPAQEARAQALFGEIRCMECQNESIDASEAPIAHDMRILVRQEISLGKTDQEVRDDMYARYGDFILLRPRLTAGTLILWLAPFAIVLIGLALLVFRRRRQAAPLEGELTTDELTALKRLETQAHKAEPR